MKSIRFKLLCLLILVSIDQYSKYIAQSIKFREIIPSFMNLSIVENPGIIFGIFSDSNYYFKSIFLIVIGFITIIYFGMLFFKSTLPKYSMLCLGLILSGSIGNVIDRIRYGHVIDFIDIYYKEWHYWTFNFADSYIIVGLFGWLLNDLISCKKNLIT